jgi:Protein of unknown function (DUF3800)
MADPEPRFIHPSDRYRLFFDETGTGDLRSARDPNERYLSLTGVVIRQDFHDGYMTRRLDRLKRDIFAQTEKNPIVLHRRDIREKTGPFSILNNYQVRREFDSRIAAIIAEIPAPAFTVSIHKMAHLDKYRVWQFDPYHYVLTCLVERFVRWLSRTGKVGDVIGEARNATHDAKLRTSFRRFYDNGSYVKDPIVRLRLISRELRLQPKSANIAGLQIADLLAHPAHRAFRIRKTDGVMPDDYGGFIANMLERYIYDRVGGRVDGIGRKWLP